MANVFVMTMATDGGTTTLGGVCVGGGRVDVTDVNDNPLGHAEVVNMQWTCTFQSAGLSSVKVHGGGRSVTVNLGTAMAFYPDSQAFSAKITVTNPAAV
jgi:hypothetical protein